MMDTRCLLRWPWRGMRILAAYGVPKLMVSMVRGCDVAIRLEGAIDNNSDAYGSTLYHVTSYIQLISYIIYNMPICNVVVRLNFYDKMPSELRARFRPGQGLRII
jgi:hypothetical protein